MNDVYPIFTAASTGARAQRSSLASLGRALAPGASAFTAITAPFLDCVDISLPGKDTASLNATHEFISRAVFLRDAALLEPCLQVRGPVFGAACEGANTDANS